MAMTAFIPLGHWMIGNDTCIEDGWISGSGVWNNNICEAFM